MSTIEVMSFTEKRHKEALESSSEVIVGLKRVTNSEVATIAASNLNAIRELLLEAGAIAASDQTTENECSSAAKSVNRKVESFNRMSALYGFITESTALTSITTHGEVVDVAEQMFVPALEGMEEPVAKALAGLGESLVKECRTAQKTLSKALAHAEISTAQWSELYLDVLERIREGRLLQTVHGFEVPKLKRGPGAGRPKSDASEPEPADSGVPGVESPEPAVAPANGAETSGVDSNAGPPAADSVAG